jgi:hypothetical protein
MKYTSPAFQECVNGERVLYEYTGVRDPFVRTKCSDEVHAKRGSMAIYSSLILGEIRRVYQYSERPFWYLIKTDEPSCSLSF